MSKTLKYILSILATVLICFVGGILMEILPPVGMGIMIVCTLALMGLIVALVIHLMKQAVARATRDFPRRNAVRGDYTWGQVAATLAILPPLGLFYVIHKTSREQEIFRLNGVKLIVMGCTLLLLTLPPICLVLAGGTDDPSGLIFLLFFPGGYTLLGAVLTVLGLRLAHRGRINDCFLGLILDEKITRVDHLATRTSMTYAQVTRRVQWLIDNDLLPGAYIYHRDREIIVPKISPRIAIKCKNCAGTSVLYANDERVCVYCGGRI